MKSRLLSSESAIVERMLERADELRGWFVHQTAAIDYESKGILYSEMLFLAACLVRKPTRIIESGRARGQSAVVLATCFPDAEIISIEHDQLSPDVPIADSRLKPYDNVTTVFGDSCKILSDYVRQDDVVLIDGPKHFRAVRLCLRVLQTRKPECVFLHDVFFGTPERNFLSGMSNSVFSDQQEFVRRYFSVNESIISGIKETAAREGYNIDPLRPSGYGPTLGCVYYHPEVNYATLRFQAMVAGFAARRLRKKCNDGT